MIFKFYLFIFLIYLYFFNNSDMCQHLIGADMAPNGIYKKF